MKRKIVTGLIAGVMCCAAVYAAACSDGNTKQPEKLKDGIPVTLAEEESVNVDLSEYISVEGTSFTYSAESSDTGVATVTVSESTATITGVAYGTATVTAGAGETKVEFAVTVTEKVTPKPVDKTKLQAEVDSAITEQGDYTEATYNAYAEQLDNARSVLSNASATQAQVDAALSALKAAREALVVRDPAELATVKNGSFNDGLEGWTMTGDVGEISEDDKFWTDKPMFNEGKYFRGESKEANTGTLASSYFTVGGINKITFMLGAAGNENCYITLEDEEENILEIWRNTKFKDGDGVIGEEIFALNLVTYVADLSAYEGQSVRVVLNDNATGGFGFFTFDELKTYYTDESQLPENAIATVNELADKSALSAALESVIEEQGDYTAESFAAYSAKVEAAKAVLANVSAKQSAVDSAIADLEAAGQTLALRQIETVQDAETDIIIVSNGSKEINIAAYINVNSLSSITYGATSADGKVTVTEISEGKYTLTAAEYTEEIPAQVTVTLSAQYKQETPVTVELTVTVKNNAVPELKETAVTNAVDIYNLDNKESITLNFAANVKDNGVAASYAVTLNGQPATLDGNNCTVYTFGTHDENETVLVYKVTVTYDGGELNYDYTLRVKDTTKYRVKNGGFDDGLNDWTMSGEIGEISEDDKFWVDKPIFNEGKYFRGESKEGNTGTLTSSEFVVGGQNKISFKLGAAGNENCYVTIIDEEGNVLETYRNYMFKDPDDWDKDRVGKDQFALNLVTYVADLSAYEGRSVRVVLNDNATGGFGFFTFDSLVTYYGEDDSLPTQETDPNGLPVFVAGETKTQ